MSVSYITDSVLEDIADAIRAKNGSQDTYTPVEMATAITNIPSGGGITPTGNISITQSGTTDVTNYATATVAAGSAGTPTATKGTVSNHSVSVTPSVTNTTGYITGSTKTGTAVSVSASELVSGTYTVDSSGTKDVTNYASATVSAGTAGTPSATKGTVSNHAVSVTPSVTNTTGWITGTTKTGTAVSVSASELVSGSETKTANGTYDVTNLAELIVNVSGSSAKTKDGTFTGNGSRQVTISCDFEPDLVYWYSDPGTSASSGTVSGLIARGMLAANQYRNNSTSNSNNIQFNITDMNTGGSSYNFRATYSNSTVTLYCFSSGSRSLFTNNRTYNYKFVKWTT